MQALCKGGGVFAMITLPHSLAETAGMPKPNALIMVASTLFGIGGASLALVISSARDALRPGGALEQLNVGEVMISEKANTRLSRRRVGVGVYTAFWVLVGIPTFVSGVIGGVFLPSSADGDADPVRADRRDSVHCARRDGCRMVGIDVHRQLPLS
jgi:hypothetical protein